MIPNLIVPGAPKSGTSSLHEYLNVHPDIEMSRIKEPHFFTSNKIYSEGLDFYRNMFLDCKAKYHGESSTAYFTDKVAIERIGNDLDEIKFIVLLRNPLERTISHYLWQVSLFHEFRSFRKAVRYNIENPVDHRKKGYSGTFKNYYFSSLYGHNINRITKYIGIENIHIITTKELYSNTNEALNSCFNFLGLDNYEINHRIVANKTKPIPSNWSAFKNFGSKFIKKGVIDLRNLFFILSPYAGQIDKEDKLWMESLLQDDLIQLKTYCPDIENRW